MGSDPGIFNFVKCVPHAGAGQGEAERAVPLQAGHHAGHQPRMAVNAAANRALAPEGSKLLELETHVIHIDLGVAKLQHPKTARRA